jgi:nucleoside-diphosphate-sugar epimerase
MDSKPKRLPTKILDDLVDGLADAINQLDGAQVAIFGGTGFIGSWITSTLVNAMGKGLKLKLYIISRNPKAINLDISKIDKSQINFLSVDLTKSIPSELAQIDKFIISSTPTSSKHGYKKSGEITQATNTMINFFNKELTKIIDNEKTILHLSSGAVYRCHKQTSKPYLENNETHKKPTDAYVSSKVVIEETLKKISTENTNIKVANPRLFAFYGPGLPLDEHFAIGNFLLDAVQQNYVNIQGNPATVRSYMHVADLTCALIKLLVNPISEPINLGSNKEITMLELAQSICNEFKCPGVTISNKDSNASYYVPDISNATNHLAPLEKINFLDGLHKWIDWVAS